MSERPASSGSQSEAPGWRRARHTLLSLRGSPTKPPNAMRPRPNSTFSKRILRLERAIAEHDAKTGRNSLVQSLASAAQTAQRSTTAFEQRLDSVRALQPLCAMKAFGFDEFIPAISGLTRAVKDAVIDRSTIALLDVESKLLSVDRSLLDRVDEARRGLIREAEDEKTKSQQLRDRLQQHSSGGGAVHLEPATVHLCRALRQAGMSPRVLCDLVEIADVAWTAAAEGLLGRDREAVFVDRSDIGRATALFKDGRREFRGASLVSLNKLDVLRGHPQSRS